MSSALAPLPATQSLVEAAARSKAWPFAEARQIVARLEPQPSAPQEVIFETGFGASGLPHIGTFSEVARTSMVRTAFRLLTEDRIATRLICFSDDMDGLRKVPTNLPNQDMLRAHLNQPLTSIPDPFGEHGSFGAHNNVRLRRFLDQFGFAYEFASSTDYYRQGRFDGMLQKMLETYDEVMSVVLPTLGEERRRTYSPFLPVSPTTGEILQVPVLERKPETGTIVFRDPDAGKVVEVPVTGGNVKCQWKADWALRWAALGVDYEMSGKDLIDSVRLSGRICRILGREPPKGFTFELFLDADGQKISKSRGNGISIDEWLTYASPESLSLFMFHKPKAAKRLHFDIIPKAVDEYFAFLDRFSDQDDERRLGNPVWHIHHGDPPQESLPITFSMLLNLASASNAHDRDVLWGFLLHQVDGLSREDHAKLNELADYAVRYYKDFVEPNKMFKEPDEVERDALAELDRKLAGLPPHPAAEDVQSAVLDVARAIPRYQDHNRRGPDGGPGVSVAWFSTLYRLLLGQERGPRFGSFVAIYGIAETRALIARSIDGSLAT